MPAGDNPTNWVPDYKPYHTVQQGKPALPSEVPRSWDRSRKIIENYRDVTFALTISLPFTFEWLMGDAECAMGIVCGAHGQKNGGNSSAALGTCAEETQLRGSWRLG